MIQLSDAELCMLEQLVYLDEEVAAAAGVSDKFGKINDGMKGWPLCDLCNAGFTCRCRADPDTL